MADRLGADAARPLVTFYDDATGERVELSVATYSNWVSKTAGLVQDELDVERGGLVLLDLPTHWQGVVWLGAAWTMGLCATDDPARAASADLVVCGPDRVQAYAGIASATPVVALSLRPLGGRFSEALPAGVTDYGSVVLAQPDVFVADDPPSAEDPAWQDSAGSLTQSAVLREALPTVPDPTRLLTDVNPCTRTGLASLVGPLRVGGGTVWVRNADPARWRSRYDEEQATGQWVVGEPVH